MLTVADVMTRRPVLTGPDAPVTEALAAMRDRGISSVLVSPPAGTIKYGILTMRDVIGKIVKFSLDPRRGEGGRNYLLAPLHGQPLLDAA